MPARALTAEELAAEFGRSKQWIYEHWKRLVAEGRLPPPLMEAGHLVWSKAQVWAYLDKPLPPKFQGLVAAHRACLDVARTTPAERIGDEVIERDRERLNRRLLANERG